MNTIGTLDYCKAELLNASADLVPNVRKRKYTTFFDLVSGALKSTSKDK